MHQNFVNYCPKCSPAIQNVPQAPLAVLAGFINSVNWYILGCGKSLLLQTHIMNCSYENPEGHNFLISFQLTSYKPPHVRGALDVSNKMQYQDDPVEIIDTRDILGPDSNLRSRLGIKSVAAIIIKDHEGLRPGDSLELIQEDTSEETDPIKGIYDGEEVSIPRNKVRKVSEIGFDGWNNITVDAVQVWELMVFGFFVDLTFTFPSANIGPFKPTYSHFSPQFVLLTF